MKTCLFDTQQIKFETMMDQFHVCRWDVSRENLVRDFFFENWKFFLLFEFIFLALNLYR